MLKFTRHAKNNMRLYKITKHDIQTVIDNPEIKIKEKDKVIAISKIKNKFHNLPLKVVYKIENSLNIIITAYPLKKPFKKGSAAK